MLQHTTRKLLQGLSFLLLFTALPISQVWLGTLAHDAVREPMVTGAFVPTQAQPSKPLPRKKSLRERIIAWLKSLTEIRDVIVAYEPDGQMVRVSELNFRWKSDVAPHHYIIRILDQSTGETKWTSPLIPGASRSFRARFAHRTLAAEAYRWRVEAYTEKDSTTFSISGEQSFSFLSPGETAAVKRQSEVIHRWMKRRPRDKQLDILLGAYYASQGMHIPARDALAKYLKVAHPEMLTLDEMKSQVGVDLEKVSSQLQYQQNLLTSRSTPFALAKKLEEVMQLSLLTLNYELAMRYLEELISISNGRAREKWKGLKADLAEERRIWEQIFEDDTARRDYAPAVSDGSSIMRAVSLFNFGGWSNGIDERVSYQAANQSNSPSPATSSPQPSAFATSPQPALPVKLIPNRRVGREIKGGETHLYSIKVTAGRFLRGTVMQHGADVVIKIYAPDGSLMEERDRPNGRYGEESFSLEVSLTGVYRVEIKPLDDKVKAGRYIVRIEPPRFATARDEQRTLAERIFQEAEQLRLERRKESWKSAVPKYQEAAAVWRGIGDSYAEGLALRTLSIIYYGLKQAEEAMKTGTKALAIFRARRNRSAEGDTLLHIAHLFQDKGDDEEALKHFEQAAVAKRVVKDVEGAATALQGAAKALSSLGDSQNKRGDKEKAANTYRRAMTLYQSAGDKRGAAALMNRLDRMSLGEQPELVAQTGPVDYVDSVVYSPKQEIIASVDSRGTIMLWSAVTGHKLRSFSCYVGGSGPGMKLTYSLSDMRSPSHNCQLAFSRDGKFLTGISIFNSIYQVTFNWQKWNVSTGELADGNRFILNPNEEYQTPYESLAISVGGTRGAAANPKSGTITVIDFDKKQHQLFENKEGRVRMIKFSSDSETVAALTNNGKVTLWDVSSGHNMQSFEPCTDLFAVSNQQKLLACGTSDNSIGLWDIAMGKKLPSLKGHAGRVVSLTFSPDDGKLISGDVDKNLQVWDLANGAKIWGSLTDRIMTDTVAFSPDGTLFASGDADKTIRLWSVGAAKELGRLTSSISGVTDVAVSPRRNLLAVCFANRVDLWNLSSGRRVKILTTDYPIYAVAFSEDGNFLAGGGQSENITLWDLETGLATTISGFENGVSALLFSPKGDQIATLPTMNVRVTVADIKLGKILLSEGPETISIGNPTTMKFAEGKLPEWAEPDNFHPPVLINNGEIVVQVIHSSEQVKFYAATSGRELASFIAVGTNDWLVTTPEGFFDGTVGAWKKLIWRFNSNTFDNGAVELYFNEFFRPDLLQDVLAGKAPRPKPGRELGKRDRRQPTVKIVSIDGKSKAEINSQPTQYSSRERTAVTVTVDVTDGTGEKKQASHNATSGAQDLRLFRNGSLVKLWHGDLFNLSGTSGCEQIKPTVPDQPRRVRCQAVVSVVAGENNFTAYAFNSSDVKSNDDVLSFNSPTGSKRRGTFYVLAVGVNDYLQARKLRYAVDDATELGAALQREQEKLGVYDSTQVITLTNAEATKKNIILALKRFGSDANHELPSNGPMQLQRIKPLAPEDALVIVFAGHGVADDERFYLLPQDVNAADLRKSAVSDSDLNNILEHVDAGQLLLIIDACRSGKALGEPKDGRGPTNSKGLAQLAYDKGMSILAAAQSYQAALEVSQTVTGTNIKHGLLTFGLLDGLINKNAADESGNVSERTWFDYAAKDVLRVQVEEMKRRQFQVQVPRVFYRREENPTPLLVAKP